MAYLSKKQAGKLIYKLKEIRLVSTMRTSSFGFDPEIDDFIRGKTQVWRETWIIDPLDKIIEELEELTNGR